MSRKRHIARPAKIIVRLKMSADGCQTRLCGRMGAKSLTDWL